MTDVAEKERIVSSAKKVVLNFETCVISFTYSKKNKGPRFEPCGTPHVTLAFCD